MRTFVAIPLPGDCRNFLESLQSGMRAFNADVRWTSSASIHLTLKFLGEINPAQLPQIAAALRAEVAVPAFSLRIGGLGGFPDLRNPRVLWSGIYGDIENLAALQSRVERACVSVGFPKEDRPFHPHLTLGRVQSKRNLQPLLDYIRIGPSSEYAFRVDRFDIYESVLTPRGAVYRIHEKIELK
jgi:2'-5' RNA ligase